MEYNLNQCLKKNEEKTISPRKLKHTKNELIRSLLPNYPACSAFSSNSINMFKNCLWVLIFSNYNLPKIKIEAAKSLIKDIELAEKSYMERQENGKTNIKLENEENKDMDPMDISK